MLRFTLDTGREVSLQTLRISGTYAGQTEGSYESVSGHIIRDLERDDGRPRQVIGTTVPLARFQCEGYLTSAPVDETDHDYASGLTVVWFVEEVPDSLLELLSPLRSGLDWEGHAEDFNAYAV